MLDREGGREGEAGDMLDREGGREGEGRMREMVRDGGRDR